MRDAFFPEELCPGGIFGVAVSVRSPGKEDNISMVAGIKLLLELVPGGPQQEQRGKHAVGKFGSKPRFPVLGNKLHNGFQRRRFIRGGKIDVDNVIIKCPGIHFLPALVSMT